MAPSRRVKVEGWVDALPGANEVFGAGGVRRADGPISHLVHDVRPADGHSGVPIPVLVGGVAIGLATAGVIAAVDNRHHIGASISRRVVDPFKARALTKVERNQEQEPEVREYDPLRSAGASPREDRLE